MPILPVKPLRPKEVIWNHDPAGTAPNTPWGLPDCWVTTASGLRRRRSGGSSLAKNRPGGELLQPASKEQNCPLNKGKKPGRTSGREAQNGRARPHLCWVWLREGLRTTSLGGREASTEQRQELVRSRDKGPRQEEAGHGLLVHTGLWVSPLPQQNPVTVWHICNSSVGRRRQENQKLNIILSYTVKSHVAWVTWDLHQKYDNHMPWSTPKPDQQILWASCCLPTSHGDLNAFFPDFEN